MIETLNDHNYFYTKLLEATEFELYIGAFAFQPNKSHEFIWYTSGQKVYPKVELMWNNGEPNDMWKLERCSSLKNIWYKVGVNDCQCNVVGITKGTMICQKLQIFDKRRGFKKPNSDK